MRPHRRVLWVVPDVCESCGARIDQASAERQPDPRCQYCRAPLPHQPFVPAVPAAMQALVDRVMAMSEAVGVAPATTGGRAAASPPAPLAPVAHVDRGAIAPGAQWVAMADGGWWRWSWFDRQWQQAAPQDGCPAAESGCWVHWVEGVDGQWTRTSWGPIGSPWPTPLGG